MREQLASGRFRSEDEVIRTALSLLEGQVSDPADLAAWLKQEIERGVSSRPAAPATQAFWDRLRRIADPGPGHDG